MSEQQPYPPQQERETPPQGEQDNGTIWGLMATMAAILLVMVAIFSGISALTGWKFEMKGAGIPGDWGSALAFLIIAAIFWGIGWLFDNFTLRRIFRKHKWLWLVVIAGVGGGGYGLVITINIFDAGGMMFYAINQGNVSKVESYLKNDKISDKVKAKMLKRATYRNKVEVAKLLIKHGAKVNASGEYTRGPNKNKKTGVTLFHRVCASNNLPMIKLFVEKGAKLNTKTVKGETPLHYALFWYGMSRRKRAPVVQYLVSKGAKLVTVSDYRRRRLYRDYPDLVDRMLPAPPKPRDPQPPRGDDNPPADDPNDNPPPADNPKDPFE